MIGTLSLTGSPTPGALLGTMGSQDLINSINSANGINQYFGSAADPFKTGYQNFMKHVVQPIRTMGTQLKNVANKIFNNDYIRAIDSEEELKKGIPSVMHDVFVLYEPLNKLALQGRIDAFGYSEDYLKGREDYWGRLLSNGTCDLTTELKNNTYTLTWIEESTDPPWTIEQLEDICETRKFIDEFYSNKKTRDYDITDYPNEKG